MLVVVCATAERALAAKTNSEGACILAATGSRLLRVSLRQIMRATWLRKEWQQRRNSVDKKGVWACDQEILAVAEKGASVVQRKRGIGMEETRQKEKNPRGKLDVGALDSQPLCVDLLTSHSPSPMYRLVAACTVSCLHRDGLASSSAPSSLIGCLGLLDATLSARISGLRERRP